jgi:hypothetical protein
MARSSDATSGETSDALSGDPRQNLGYLCVYSRSDPAVPNVPLLRATNPIGSLMLESGMMPIFGNVADALGSAGEVLMNVMPIEMIGVEVHEELHRFDIQGLPPDLEHGIRASNQVGEHIAAVTMRWMIAPDDFEPAIDKVPPPTALVMTRSQKFVMLGGRMTFRDAAQSGLRGFGSGRTFPTVVRGKPQLRIAAVVNVLEGFGNLKGLTGTIVVNGYVQPPKGLFINFVARFIDPSGQLRSAVPPSALQPIPEPDSSTTFLAFLGEIDPADQAAFSIDPSGRLIGTRISERLRLIRTGFDLGPGSADGGLRTFVTEGPAIGSVSANLAFDPADTQATVPMTSTDGVFSFVDAGGRSIGTLRANFVEGRIFREHIGNRAAARLAGLGPIIGGTGAFDGAIGMVTVNAGVGVSSLYVIRVSDPDGRFRKVLAGGGPQVAASASGNGAAASADPSALTAKDELILSQVERTIERGVEVKTWLDQKDRAGDYAERFDVIRPFSPDVNSFGFFETVPVAGSMVRVMGLTQDMVFDRWKQPAPGAKACDEFREFLFKYFMRVSHGRKPAVAAEVEQPSIYLRPLSWLPSGDDARVGFGYRQLYYKLRESGRIGKFAKEEQCAVVDLREIGAKYDWIVAKVRIFDFNIAMEPLGGESMKFLYPMKEESYVVLSPSFVTCDERPDGAVLGRFSLGYSFLPYADEPGIVAYGPGFFSVAIQTFDFAVRADAEIDVRASFVVNRPDKIMRVDLDPVGWSFKVADLMTGNLASRVFAPVKAVADRLPLRVPDVDPVSAYIAAANVATAGLASSQLGISKVQLEKRMLVQHFLQHHEMLMHALQVWRTFNNWCDPKGLPEYCHTGIDA